MVEVHGVSNGFGRDLRGRNALGGSRQGALAINQFSVKRQGVTQRLQMLQKTVDLDAWMCAQSVFDSDKDVFNKGRGNDT